MASATTWSNPPGLRRSATRCWIHQSGWRPGCSTTTRTAITRSPARLSMASPWAISPRKTSFTTSRCTWLKGSGASAARLYWESGQAQAGSPCDRPSFLRRSRFRSPSRRSGARSLKPRAAGSRRSIQPSCTLTKSAAAATSLPGSSRNSFQKRFVRPSDLCANSEPESCYLLYPIKPILCFLLLHLGLIRRSRLGELQVTHG